MTFAALTLPFLFYTATGNFPLEVFGVKSSNAYTIIYTLVVLAMSRSEGGVRRGAAGYAGCLMLLVALLFLSALWSDDRGFSMYRAAVVSGYIYLAFALPKLAVARRFDLLGSYAKVALVTAALLVLTYFTFQPAGSRAVFPLFSLPAFSIEPLDDFDLNDPNIVACALSVGLIGFMRHEIRRNRAVLGGFVFALAILLTQSRTALLFLPLSCVAACALAGYRVKAMVFAALAGAAVLVLLFSWVSSTSLYDDALFAALFERFGSDSASNFDRTTRLDNALLSLHEPFVFLFGMGAGASISSGLEPHNMFITFFLETGVAGFLAFLGLFVFGFDMSRRVGDVRDRFFAYWLLAFIFFSCLTYWHTRTLWISLSFVYFVHLLDARSARRAQRPRTTGYALLQHT